MKKHFLIWGFLFGLTAVILGAIGAHALKPLLSEAQLDSFETGVRFQIYHALMLIILSQIPSVANKAILILIVLGTLLFSVSIYLLNVQEPLGLGNLNFLGPITPVGGLLLISAWLIMLIKAFKLKLQ